MELIRFALPPEVYARIACARVSCRDTCTILEVAKDVAAVEFYPTPHRSAWTGEGLPPVGVMCELNRAMKFTEGSRLDDFPAGTEVLVGGHANFYGGTVVSVCVKNRNYTGTVIPECLRPIRTPEQIAAEVRSKACDAIYGVLTGPSVERKGNTSDMAEALYDAGYRKTDVQ